MINSIKSNAKLGKGDWAILEADESDGSFLKLPINYSIVTNIDLEHLVSESTAKEMCSAELNSVTFHRKFDGKLRNIHLNLRKKDSNEDMIEKINEVLGLQQIEEYIDCEDENIGSEEESDNIDSESEASKNLEESQTSEESEQEELLIPLEQNKS